MPLTGALALTLIDSLRPSKSPHLVASTIGVFALLYACRLARDLEDYRFLLIAIPIYITLALIVIFSFKDKSLHDPDEDVEIQFRFSRAMGIGSAVIAMTMAAIMVKDEFEFHLAYLAAGVQLMTFILYSTIRLIKEESQAQAKVFQISFMMFVFLISSVYCLSKSGKAPDEWLFNRFALTSLVFGALWLVYELFWIRRIWQIVEVRLRETELVERSKRE